MVDQEKGIGANKWAEEHVETLSCILSATELLQELDTLTQGSFQHKWNRKDGGAEKVILHPVANSKP